MTRQTKIAALLEKTDLTTEQELQEFLKKKYYSEVPIISDAEYDELFGDKDYVGYTPDKQGPWEILEHKIPMGSLNKIKTWDDIQKWINNRNVVWQPKLDGLSIELTYEHGKLTHAILRGGGDKGEDIWKNAIHFEGVLPIINTILPYVSVRGEVVISKSKFNQLDKEMYKNRRNCIPGICRRYDGNYSNSLSFYAYDIIEKTDFETKEYSNYKDKVKALYEYGFKIPFTLSDMTEEKYNQYAEIRNDAEEFQMDGLVIKSLDDNDMIALKFPPNGERTKVTHYTWDVGSTGKLVPVIHFESVNIGGTNLTKASVGSYKLFKELDAPAGSIVEVRKMNDVIPKVTRRIEKSDQILEIPARCPVCDSLLSLKGADLYCVNSECMVKTLQSCTQVYSSMMLKGVTANWVKALMIQGKIKVPADVLRTTPEDIATIDGYSINTGNKVVEHMQTKIKEMFETNNIKQFLNMIPIPSIGGKALDKFASMFNNFNQLENWLNSWDDSKLSELITVLGNSKAKNAYEYIQEHLSQIKELLNIVKIL